MGVGVAVVHHVHHELHGLTEIPCRVIVGFVFVPPGTPLATGVVLCVSASTHHQWAVLSALAHNMFVGESSSSHCLLFLDNRDCLCGVLNMPTLREDWDASFLSCTQTRVLCHVVTSFPR